MVDEIQKELYRIELEDGYMNPAKLEKFLTKIFLQPCPDDDRNFVMGELNAQLSNQNSSMSVVMSLMRITRIVQKLVAENPENTDLFKLRGLAIDVVGELPAEDATANQVVADEKSASSVATSSSSSSPNIFGKVANFFSSMGHTPAKKTESTAKNEHRMKPIRMPRKADTSDAESHETNQTETQTGSHGPKGPGGSTSG